MKQNYVPIDKQTKKKRKMYYAAQRRDWGEVNPVTRTTPNLKAYNRKKSGRRFEHEPTPGFFMLAVYLISAETSSQKEISGIFCSCQ